MNCRLRVPSFVLLLLLLVSLTAGCERKPEDLEQWRTAKGGMEKMQEWAQSDEQPRAVRVRAIEILVEEGRANALEPTLEGVKDEALRTEMVQAAVPVVEKMWATQDFPRSEDADKEQGGVMVGASEAVNAKDAAFFLLPFASGDAKQKLEAILAEWMSTDWHLRNQIGTTTLGQLATRAGDAGNKNLLAWLKEAQEPARVTDIITRQGDDKMKAEAAEIMLARAMADYPKVTPELSSAIFAFNHEALAPYLEKTIADPQSSNTLVGSAMDALVRARGERAAPFFSDLVKTRSGLIRWVAATHLVEILGKPGFAHVSTALPVELDTYPDENSTDLKENVEYFCNMYKGEMADAGVKSAEDQVSRALGSARWPARVLALQCAELFQYTGLRDEVLKLKGDRQYVPGWGARTTVGEIATGVAEKLSKS